MTETALTPPPAVPITQALGQAVGQAEAILSRLLVRVLAEAGTSRQDYLALQRLAALGGAAAREAYVDDLSRWLFLDLWAAGEVADSLTEAGLLATADGAVRFTPDGTDLRDRVAGLVSPVTRSVVAPLDQADVATTVRTLQEIAARGRELLSAGAAG